MKAIAPTFGGINLEDIKAPECFEIDRRLSEELDIPVMHDDQHGTAVISTAAMLNAVKIAGKTLDKLRVVVNGAGAAAIACARLFIAVGVRRENMVFCDSRGVVTTYRTDINEIKREFATTRRITTLAEALHGADLFLGVSTADVLTPEMLRTMSTDPIVMALANPDPKSPTTKPSYRVRTSSSPRGARTTPTKSTTCWASPTFSAGRSMSGPRRSTKR